MNHLFRYLATTTPEEQELISTGGLTPREEETFHRLVALTAKESPTKEQACNDLQMSSSMFDKTCSILLKKVYEQLVPTGGRDLLVDLLRRGLLSHFEYELRRGEREIDTDDVPGLRDHYVAILQALQTQHIAVEADRVAQYIRRQIRDLPLSPADRLRLSSETLIFEVFATAMGNYSVERHQQLLATLKGMERQIDRETDIETVVRIYDALATYYTHLDSQPDEQRHLLEQIWKLLEKQGKEKNRKRIFVTRFKLAESEHLTGSLQKAWRDYTELYRESRQTLLETPYIVDKYVQASLALGKYDVAAEILGAAYGEDRTLLEPNLRVAVAMNYAKLYLLTNQLEQVEEQLDLIIALNQKDAYVATECEYRMLQSTWHLLKGDPATVEDLASANMKYFRSKGFGLRSGDAYPWYIKSLLLLIEQKQSGTPLPQSARPHVAQFFTGAGVVYGALLLRSAESLGVELADLPVAATTA